MLVFLIAGMTLVTKVKVKKMSYYTSLETLEKTQ